MFKWFKLDLCTVNLGCIYLEVSGLRTPMLQILDNTTFHLCIKLHT